MPPDQPPGDPPHSAAPFPITPVHPDLLAFARQTLDLGAFEAEIRDVPTNGGHTLESFIDELKAHAGAS